MFPRMTNCQCWLCIYFYNAHYLHRFELPKKLFYCLNKCIFITVPIITNNKIFEISNSGISNTMVMSKGVEFPNHCFFLYFTIYSIYFLCLFYIGFNWLFQKSIKKLPDVVQHVAAGEQHPRWVSYVLPLQTPTRTSCSLKELIKF